jgi:DNA-binding NarL/FixJ family response regulator
MKRARVLLAEDHVAVAEHLRGLLETEFQVVAVVTDGFALLGAAQTLKPDVIVADITLPGLDGIAAATRIFQHDPHARIVFETVHNDPGLVQRCMEMGVLGYVLKMVAGDELVPAVHAALAGQKYVSPHVNSRRLNP